MALCKISLSRFIFCLAVIQGIVTAGDQGQGNRAADNDAEEYRIRLSFDGKEAIVRLRDHPTTRDLLSRLPMTMDFQDYVGKEKIAYLHSNLSSDGSSAKSRGDFAYYAPWGNIAIFYQGSGNAGDGLIVLGSIESGKSDLATMRNDFTMVLERIQ